MTNRRTPLQMTNEQLRILRHMLGIDDPYARVPKPYRNYYCASHNYAPLMELERLGAVRLYRTDERYHWYTCTESGKLAAMRSHKTIRLPKSKRVYAAFLNARDAFQDLTFKDFLTRPEFLRSRVDA